jgi:hypothetical protein
VPQRMDLFRIYLQPILQRHRASVTHAEDGSEDHVRYMREARHPSLSGRSTARRALEIEPSLVNFLGLDPVLRAIAQMASFRFREGPEGYSRSISAPVRCSQSRNSTIDDSAEYLESRSVKETKKS